MRSFLFAVQVLRKRVKCGCCQLSRRAASLILCGPNSTDSACGMRATAGEAIVVLSPDWPANAAEVTVGATCWSV